MGQSIGQIPSTLIAARRQTPAVNPAARGNDRDATNFEPNGRRDNTRNAPATETPQAGFGPGTVSGPAAALVALGRSVRSARETIPTLDEIREQFQARRTARLENFELQGEAQRARFSEQRDSQEFTVPAADALAFSRFNEAREFSESSETEPVPLASARPPEAPEFASAEQPDEATGPAPEAPEPGPAPDDLQRRRLNLTA